MNANKLFSIILITLICFSAWPQPQPGWDIEIDLEYWDAGQDQRSVFLQISNCGPSVNSYEIGPFTKIQIEYEGLVIIDSSILLENTQPGRATCQTRPIFPYCSKGSREYPSRNVIEYLLEVRIVEPENAYLTAEVVEVTEDYFHVENPNGCVFLRQDVDSTPNNGVDSDGDGDISDDPDDEDDGDGIRFYEPPNPLQILTCDCSGEDCNQEFENPSANPTVVGNAAETSSDGNIITGTGAPGIPPAGSSGPGSLGSPAGSGPGGGGSLSAEAGCMIAADVPSSFPANPEEPNAALRFDYFIESIARIGYIETDGTIVNQELKMNYHVNSNDGSMFFATGQEGFFAANALPTGNRSLKNHGVAWKADGQRVTYGLDRTTNTLRAAIVEQDQTAADVAGQKILNVKTFLNSLGGLTRSPAALPAHLAGKWGEVPGYVGRMNDVGGTSSTVTIYMGRSPDIAPIPTSTPLVGFLTGIFKDPIQNNCNKLAVYTKMEYGGDFIEVELINITPQEFEFDGTPYTVTPIGGAPGTAYKQSQAQLEREAMALERQRLDLDAQRRRDCAGDDLPCNNAYKAQMEALQDQIDDLQCKALCLAGMEAALPDCRCN